jgi:hypothetical protein
VRVDLQEYRLREPRSDEASFIRAQLDLAFSSEQASQHCLSGGLESLFQAPIAAGAYRQHEAHPHRVGGDWRPVPINNRLTVVTPRERARPASVLIAEIPGGPDMLALPRRRLAHAEHASPATLPATALWCQTNRAGGGRKYGHMPVDDPSTGMLLICRLAVLGRTNAGDADGLAW